MKYPGFIAALSLPLSAIASAAPMQVFQARGAVSEQLLIGQVLVSHNAERRRLGLASLAWDRRLAVGAQLYANELARSRTLQHSPKVRRPGVGENLWRGTRGYFSPAAMVGGWTSERSMFRGGRFPDVSTSGNWADVGHYTQMIWPTTQRVGCAIGQSFGDDVLVCRYWPSGNVTGKPVP